MGLRGMIGAVTLASTMLVTTMTAPAGASPIDDAINELNRHSSVEVTPARASYRIVFDAYLEMSPPPMEIGEFFNHRTIWPGMPGWENVASWAEANASMAEVIIQSRERLATGLPYGRESIEAKYAEAGLGAFLLGEPGQRKNDFGYQPAMDVILAYVAAECYRLFEADRPGDAIRLAVANCYHLRQYCDRQFTSEKRWGIVRLSEALANIRDMMWTYGDDLATQTLKEMAWFEILGLRPSADRLEMPEGDRVLTGALLRVVFDDMGQAKEDAFGATFGALQAADQPLTRFGAARRWTLISFVHSSLDASLERLTLIYDDWWRRWRIKEHDPILEDPTEFDRTNPVRYAAVTFPMEDVGDIFAIRNRLIAEVNGCALAAGLCAHYHDLGSYPNDIEQIYAQYARKTADTDPWDLQYGPFKYFKTRDRRAVDTTDGRIWVAADTGLLWSIGTDQADARGETHFEDAGPGSDLVFWPPMKALAREQGLTE